MPDFNVGDRFVFTRDNPDGGGEYGRTGEIGIISRPYDENLAFNNGIEVYFNFEDLERRIIGHVAYELLVPINSIRLLEPEPLQEVQTIIRYMVVYQYPDGDGPYTQVSNTLANAERTVRLVREGNGIILATKKITIVVPVVVFPELEVDEDDNIIEDEEEEDDDNGF